MAIINPHLPIITLSANGLNSPIQIHRMKILKKINNMLFTRNLP